MQFISETLEAYCLSKSSRPSEDCVFIEDYTKNHLDDAVMLSGPFVASLLGFLIRLGSAKRILEIGTYTGYSALAMAENLPATGELFTLDIDAETQKLAQTFWDKSLHGRKITALSGDAKETLGTLKGSFDFVFLDADKEGYLEYVELALPLLSEKGVIAVDNTLWSGRVLTPEKDRETQGIQALNDWASTHKNLYSTLVPIRDGVLLLSKI